MTSNGSKRLRFNAYEVDTATGELWKLGMAVKLAGQPFQILAYLLRRPGQLVTREELRGELWPGETFVDFDHGLNAAINKLRLVLCDSAEDPKYIETLPRRGYRFIAAVEEISNEAAGAYERSVAFQSSLHTAVPATPPAGSEIAAGNEPRSPGIPGTSGTRRLWLIGAAATMLAVAGVWLLVGRTSERSNAGKTTEARPPITLSSLTRLPDRTSQPAFSPDGSRVAFVREGFASGNSGIWSKQISGDQLIQLTKSESDCCPVWSPDGQWLAFSRTFGTSRKVYKVAANGGELQELFATDMIPTHGELDWSPDGKTIAYVAQGAQGAQAIFLRSLDRGKTRQITSSTALEPDWGPAFSPDGSRIAFIRRQDIMLISADGRELQHLGRMPFRLAGSPRWTPDGQSIVFVAISGEGPRMMRISAMGGSAISIGTAGDLALDPAIAKRGFRLACDQLTVSSSLDQIDLSRPGEKARTLVASHRGENGGVQISHDGKKLVFQSNRTGENEIWISDRDGENPIRMTALGAANAPSWSPDDKEIAFEARSRPGAEESQGIYLVNANGGEPWPLIQDRFNHRAPRWSNDGKWIYFGSDRSGAWEIWKIGAWGGSPVRVTHQGGFVAEESLDGKYLFYVKQNGESVEMWKMAVVGGTEMRLSPAIHPLDWAAWAIARDGLLFVEHGADDDASISLLDLSSERVKSLAVLDKPPFWMAATRDGRSVIFDQPGQFESHVALLENFR